MININLEVVNSTERMKISRVLLLSAVLLLYACGNSSPKRTTYRVNINGSEAVQKNNETTGGNPQTKVSSSNTQTKSWRQELPGGGYCEFVQHEDGSLTTKRVQPCLACHGTKICQGCGGTGGTYGRAYGGIYYPCKMCLQTGQCSTCKGEGSVVTVSTTDASGNTNLQSSNGYSAVGGPGGVIVTDPNGRRTAIPSGGGSRSNNSPREDRSNDYIETIEYAPNYTGESNDVWCDKCQEYAPRHSHIKKRIR